MKKTVIEMEQLGNKMVKKVIIEIEYLSNNYAAHAPILQGCVSTGDSLENVKKNIVEAIQFHIESSLEYSEPIPDTLKGEYEFEFKLSTEALLNAYSNIFTKAALSRITGINERQLWHYAAGVKKPRSKQTKRIEEGLHELGNQLLSLHL